MKYFKFNYILMLLLAGMLVSCKDFLDIKPYGKTIPKTTEEYAAIINDMLGAVDGNLNSTTQSQNLFFNNEWVSLFEQYCDNLETNLTEYPLGSYLSYYIGQLDNNSSLYYSYYQMIARCNIILDNYTDGRDTQEGRDLVGTAYAIRGMAYYQLLRLYCEPIGLSKTSLGVPLTLQFDMEERPVRSTIQQTIAQIESDFKLAMECNIQNEMYRFDNITLTACMARLYFWSNRWNEAKTLAAKVLEAHPLLADADYVKMMTANEGLEGNMIFRSDRLPKSSNSTLNSYLKARPASIRLLKLYKEGQDDVRYSIFFDTKRKNNKVFFAGIRSAEMALIVMESDYHMGNTADALNLLNDFRAKRISNCASYTLNTLPPVDENDIVKCDCLGNPLTPLLYAILCERRKELYLEGDRFFELKRNGCPEFWVVHNGLKYTNYSYMYTLPIPAHDIILNPKLIQNEGYTEMKY